MTRVGIIGVGAVGTAVLLGMEPYHEVLGYDIDGRGSFKDILDTNAVLICVATDGLSPGELDMSAIEETVRRLDETDYSGLVIVKSTLQPGTMEKLENIYPALRICYMPEFLRERDANEWFASPDRLVVSGPPEVVAEALKLFEWIPAAVPRLPMTHLEAELGKLAHNAFIATKVTFTCEIERISLHHSADPQKVMEVVWKDRRICNPAHLTPGLGGFDGKCVPKDTRALSSADPNEDGLLAQVLRLGSAEAVETRMRGTVNRE